jgi:RNA ligase (TIGR02306 family)
MRKLATIRKIDQLLPIEGADAIECAVVGGWKVVAQKGLYEEGDLAVYFEIDSWIPTELAPFLSKGKEPREFEGVKGERLKTIKLRGQLSQGLLMPIREIDVFKTFSVGDDNSFDLCPDFDVTEVLGIKKWEKPMNAQLAGMARGNFPSLIPKTDQERVQNLKKEVAAAAESNAVFEVTEKLEGSSMTCYLIEGVFGVCSRNLDLKESEGNAFWEKARADDIEAKMRNVSQDIAIQGELIGPGIQGNIYKLSKTEFYVFDVYDIKRGEYLKPADRLAIVQAMGLNHVPVIHPSWPVTSSIEGILESAEGQTVLLTSNTEREGIVFKEVNGGMTFKAISNKYLLGEK